MDTLKVRDAADVEQVVRSAIASEQPLEIIGHGSKRLIGQPMATNALLDLSALNAVTSYEPNELIITVQAGAPLADVLSLINSKNQQFAFEPINTSRLLGTPDIGTIGGMIGAGLAGPRRIKAGGARDHLLGAHAVSGFGDSFKAGGKVVKNVTGYDLCKLLAGSWGTLAVMTEVTLEGDAAARERAHAGAARAGRRRGQPGDDGGAGLAVRCVRRGACAELGVSRRGRQRAWRSRIAAAGGHACCGWKASRHRSPIARPRSARSLAPFGAAEIARRCGLGGDLGFGPRRSAVRGQLARWAHGRCGASSARRPRAVRSARRWRAIPAAT